MHPIEQTQCEEVGGGLDDTSTTVVKDPVANAHDRPWHSLPLPRPVSVP